jgi:hypothetical protein
VKPYPGGGSSLRLTTVPLTSLLFSMPLTKDTVASSAYREALDAGCSVADAETAYHIAAEDIEPAADEDYGPNDRLTNDVY